MCILAKSQRRRRSPCHHSAVLVAMARGSGLRHRRRDDGTSSTDPIREAEDVEDRSLAKPLVAAAAVLLAAMAVAVCITMWRPTTSAAPAAGAAALDRSSDEIDQPLPLGQQELRNRLHALPSMRYPANRPAFRPVKIGFHSIAPGRQTETSSPTVEVDRPSRLMMAAQRGFVQDVRRLLRGTSAKRARRKQQDVTVRPQLYTVTCVRARVL